MTTTTTASLHARLSALTDARKTTQTLITRLSRLPASPGSSNNSDVRAELSGEIHQLLKEQEEELDLVRQDLEDFVVGRGDRREKEAERARLDISVQRLGEDLKLARTQFRKAQLTAKRNAELAAQQERELLFANQDEEGVKQRLKDHRRGGGEGGTRSKDDVVVDASSDVTAALRRTHQLMQSELSRSQFAQDTLQQSTEALQTLSESYTDLSTLLANSRSLLSTLLRSQKSDTWYLETAFYVLIGTIIWLIFRRFLYGPLWWLVWFPLKLFFRSSVGVLTATGLIGHRGVSSAFTTSTSTTLIVKPSATGARPTWDPDVEAPTVVVGGGRKHIPQEYRPPTEIKSNSQTSLVEKIATMVEETQQEVQEKQEIEENVKEDSKTEEEQKVEESKEEEVRPNRKKRMWEEDKEAKKLDEKVKDEL
ncbi:MAG: hypothetical protein M1823_001374 [Watsoniomyces obsoletus]|nr:MAG: hypothetical protein M1823_001374 [Watsoniomyces obsoletus]